MNANHPQSGVRAGSLLEGLEDAAPQVRKPTQTLGQQWKAWLAAKPGRAGKVKKAGVIAGCALALGAAAGAYFHFRPAPKPDFEVDPFDDVLFYAFLTEDFNKLPLDERLALITDLVQRFKSMDGSEIPLVASFAAGIAGEGRRQLEKNASRLVLDIFDKHAIEYDKVPLQERDQFLDKAWVELTETMEKVGGGNMKATREQRLDAGKRVFGEEIKKARSRERDNKDVGQFMSSVNDIVGPQTTGPQRSRMSRMMRDMSRHFRGEKLD